MSREEADKVFRETFGDDAAENIQKLMDEGGIAVAVARHQELLARMQKRHPGCVNVHEQHVPAQQQGLLDHLSAFYRPPSIVRRSSAGMSWARLIQLPRATTIIMRDGSTKVELRDATAEEVAEMRETMEATKDAVRG
eukprot:gene56170-44201_t